MPRQPEQILEDNLVAQLQKLGYAFMAINDEKDLLANLKSQLEKHNNITFTTKEFDKVLNILSKGSVFEKAKTLREKQIKGGSRKKKIDLINGMNPKNVICQLI